MRQRLRLAERCPPETAPAQSAPRSAVPVHHRPTPRHTITARPGVGSPCCRHTHATGATQRPCPAACGGRGVPGRYLGDDGFIRQVLEDRGVVVTVLHDDREFSGDLPGVREGT